MVSPTTGKFRRLARWLPSTTERTLIVPVDDSLIFGPTNGLGRIASKLNDIISGGPDAILLFSGMLTSHAQLLSGTPAIVNITASTIRSQHTEKTLVSNVEHALSIGAEGVAVHVNLTSRKEQKMLGLLGMVAAKCQRWGMPLLAIVYPRNDTGGTDFNYSELRDRDRIKYADLICHCARVGLDLGADVVKTQYTGDPYTFSQVVSAAGGVPIVVAGGERRNPEETLRTAVDIMAAGASGLSFGRNVFSRSDSKSWVIALRRIVHEKASFDEVAGNGLYDACEGGSQLC